jgi:hypothetical protein
MAQVILRSRLSRGVPQVGGAVGCFVDRLRPEHAANTAQGLPGGFPARMSELILSGAARGLRGLAQA